MIVIIITVIKIWLLISMLRPMTNMMPAYIILHKTNVIDRETITYCISLDMSTYIHVVTCIIITFIIIIIIITNLLFLLLGEYIIQDARPLHKYEHFHDIIPNSDYKKSKTIL